MRKEWRRVHREWKDSYTDENGVHHPHVSSRWSESEVEIDQYGNVIERNPDGTIKKKKLERKDSWENPIHPSDSDFQKARKMIYYERKRWMDEGATPEEAWLSKEEIKELAEDFNLKITDPEVDELYAEQLKDENMVDEVGHFGNNMQNEPLTRAEIEALAKKKGIHLTEDEIQAMMNGDPKALEKLKLTENEKAEIQKQKQGE